MRTARYGALLLIWLAIMATPIVALTLASRGEISVGEVPGIRLFLVSSEGSRGIGMQLTTMANQNCRRERIGFLMWKGATSGQATSYCSCGGDDQAESCS